MPDSNDIFQGEKFGGPGGSEGAGLDYNQLMEHWTGGSLGNYLSDEFDLSSKYLKYLTPLSEEPFEIAREGRDSKLAALGSTALQTLGKTRTEASDVRSKSDLAFSSSIEDTVNQAKRGLFSDYRSGASQTVQQFGSSKYDEEQRQLERFYDDVGSVIQMREAANQDSGGKK